MLPQHKESLKEELADIEHQRWSDWQKYLHSRCIENTDGSLNIINTDVLRWNRQIGTHYDHLSEKEKQSDRDQVDRYWPLIEKYVDSLKAEWVSNIKKLRYKDVGYRTWLTERDCGFNDAIDDVLALINTKEE